MIRTFQGEAFLTCIESKFKQIIFYKIVISYERSIS